MEADKIAAVIRRVNGDNSMGAGALAEAIVSSTEYAQVKAKAQVEALREAADPFQNVTGSDTPVFSPATADYLYTRADRIAREAGIETGESND